MTPLVLAAWSIARCMAAMSSVNPSPTSPGRPVTGCARVRPPTHKPATVRDRHFRNDLRLTKGGSHILWNFQSTVIEEFR